MEDVDAARGGEELLPCAFGGGRCMVLVSIVLERSTRSALGVSGPKPKACARSEPRSSIGVKILLLFFDGCGGSWRGCGGDASNDP